MSVDNLVDSLMLLLEHPDDKVAVKALELIMLIGWGS